MTMKCSVSLWTFLLLWLLIADRGVVTRAARQQGRRRPPTSAPSATTAFRRGASFHPADASSSSARERSRDNTRHRRHVDIDELLALEMHLHLALSVRGGGSSSSGNDALHLDDDDENAGFVVRKVRNVIRSMLQYTAKTPVLPTLLKTVLGTIETLSGVSLLPKEKKRKKKKTKVAEKKKTKAKSKKTKVGADEDENDEDENVSTKSKASSSSSSTTTTKKKKTSASSRAKNASSGWDKKEIKSSSPNYRIQRELKAFLADPPPNLTVKVGKNLRIWIVTMTGATGTIYEGEVFKLRIAFPAQYPQVPPSVYFLPPHIPLHEHVYTNGDICLSLLGKDWRPTMTGQSIAVSILSILSSAQHKALPMDNAKHAQNRPGQYQKDWVYHDDSC